VEVMLNNVITRDPEILGGAPVFAGTRVPFDALLDYIEGGKTLDEFLDDFPTVTRDAAIAALEQTKALLASQL
jgi:uncharacterized protein (DUF433 family)